MLKHHLVYTPLPSPPTEIEAEVKLKLLAGHHLGPGDEVVEFHLHGHPLDQTLDPWSFSAGGPHPHWQDDGQIVLTVRRPELAVLQVKVVRQAGSPLSTYISLPLLPRGFRRLVIRREDLQPPPALIFQVTRQ